MQQRYDTALDEFHRQTTVSNKNDAEQCEQRKFRLQMLAERIQR
jgi:hypothetical protein